MLPKVAGGLGMAEGGGEQKVSLGRAAAFISYALPDAVVANSIVENLERQGLRCWLAPRWRHAKNARTHAGASQCSRRRGHFRVLIDVQFVSALPIYFAVFSAAAIALLACAIAFLIAVWTQGGSVSTEVG